MLLEELVRPPRPASRCLPCSCKSPILFNKRASADRDLLQLATNFSDFVCTHPPFVHNNETIIADLSTRLPKIQCGPDDTTAKRLFGATQRGPERPSQRRALHADVPALPDVQHDRNKQLERQYLKAAFKRAAMVANGAEEAIARGLHLSQLAFESPSLNKWAEAGIKAVNKMSDEQIGAGWVYGMLELLECLTLACGESTDKRARKDFLLVSAPFRLL